MGGKTPQTSVPQTTHHTIPVRPGFFAPALVTLISLPLGFIFTFALPGVPLGFALSIIGFGLLTGIDLKSGLLRSVLGSTATLLMFSYLFQSSLFNLGGASSPNFSFIFASGPPAIAVFLGTFMFSKTERYRIPKLNVLATLSTGVALIIASSQGSSSNPIGANLVSSSIFILLGLGSNCVQMIPLYFLDKFWQLKKYSLTVLPTAFFAYNAIVGYDYFTSPTTTQAYTYFSSLAFLPILAIAAMGASGLALKNFKAPVKAITNQVKPPQIKIALPKVSITGEHSVKQGRIETIKIATESEGKTRDMATIKAELQSPNGKHDPLRIAHMSAGKYTINYQTSKPGNYNAQITATDRANQTIKQSFPFTVVAPPASHPPPAAKPTPPALRPPASNPRPASPPLRAQPVPVSPPPVMPSISSPPAPAAAIPKSGLPSLDRWDPKVWVNQEIHGYRVVEHIASGASGYVLRATFGQAGTEVALKVPILRTTIRPRAANEPTAGTITLNETMTEATRLLELSGQSKYVVQIRGILVDRLNIQEIMKGNMTLYYRSPPAIVMEYMKGGPAKRLIEDPEYEPLYYSEKWGGIVVLLGQMMSQALDMIHNAGFVHLDVKPQNVLFTTKPPLTGQEMLDQMLSGTLTPKLADLGSAVRVEGRVIQFTSEYAPGEQVLGEDAQPSMDVYALGASLYTMLTRTPVHSFKLIEVMNNVTTAGGNVSKAEKELESVWDSFSPDFTRIDSRFSAIVPTLKSMLARDPGRRPDSGSVASSLQKLLDKKGNLS